MQSLSRGIGGAALTIHILVQFGLHSLRYMVLILGYMLSMSCFPDEFAMMYTEGWRSRLCNVRMELNLINMRSIQTHVHRMMC